MFQRDVPLMKKFLRPRHAAPKAAALIIVLAFVVLVTGLALTYFTRTTSDRQLAQSSYNDTSAALLARTALDVVVGDFKQEIVNGSTRTNVSGTTIYIPINATNMVPQQSGNVAGAVNLIRRSVRSDGINFPGVASRASAVSSQDDRSANGRYINSTRWNEHYLIPKGNTATPDSSPIQAFTLATPDWVIVTRAGPTPFPSWDATLADPTSSNYAIGRYAYAVYDEGGLLNMNIVGYPVPATPWPGLTQDIARNKTVPGAFDLTALGTPVMSSVANPFNQVIGFRNYATAQAATPPETISGRISGTLGSFSVDQAAVSNFIAYVLGSPVGQPKLGFGPSGRDFGAVNPVSTSGNPAATPGRTDQSFMTRAELINLFKSLNFDCTTNTGICINTLQYLGTFSLEQNKPTLPLTPATVWPFDRVLLPQRFYLGNLNCIQHPEPTPGLTPPICAGDGTDIRANFGLQYVGTGNPGSGPCDNQIRWQYVGNLTAGCASPTPTPTASPTPTPTPTPTATPSSSTMDFFQYINYALFGRTCEAPDDTTHVPYTLGIGAALIDQYDTDALNTGIYYGSNATDPCNSSPPVNACLVYGPEQTGSTVTYPDPAGGCIPPPTRPDTRPTSPFDINQPTRSVGEFGWAYSILNAANNRNSTTTPKYLIDFRDAYNSTSNPDPALLDFFTYNTAPVRAGIVNLNTRQPVVLSAILKTAYCGFAILNQTQAMNAAMRIVNATTAQPAMSRADIPSLKGTALNPPPLCDNPDSQDKQDTLARALAEVTQTRTWGLLIDVVAQTGHYKPNATNLQTDFVVEGEKHYWLHVAIDRFDGSIVGQQLEEVTE